MSRVTQLPTDEERQAFNYALTVILKFIEKYPMLGKEVTMSVTNQLLRHWDEELKETLARAADMETVASMALANRFNEHCAVTTEQLLNKHEGHTCFNWEWYFNKLQKRREKA